MSTTISTSAKAAQSQRILSNCKLVYGKYLDFDFGIETEDQHLYYCNVREDLDS
jgi:hypothetical protein